MMSQLPRRLFATLLLLSGFVTGFLGLRTLIDRQGMMRDFGVDPSQAIGLDLLIAVLGGVLISLAMLVLLAALWSFQARTEGRTLGLLCALTLLVVAASAFIVAGSVQVLLLDGVRGLVLLGLGLCWKPSGKDR